MKKSKSLTKHLAHSFNTTDVLFLFPTPKSFKMAKFRKVHTAFWDDPLIEKLSPDVRYFYLFLMTNPLSTECGIYQITIKKMCDYTGYNFDAVKALIKTLEVENSRIIYDTTTEEVCLLKRPNYIENTGKPVIDCLIKEFKNTKNKQLIVRQKRHIESEAVMKIYATWYDTWYAAFNKLEQEEEEEEEEEEEKEGQFDEAYFLKKKEQMIVTEMVKIWKKQFPDSYVDKETDYPACLQIAYKIADDKNIPKGSVVYQNEKVILEAWSKIVDYIPTNAHYVKLGLKQLVNNFSGLKQSMIADMKSSKSKKSTSAGFDAGIPNDAYSDQILK
jgi:hypothetical protein